MEKSTAGDNSGLQVLHITTESGSNPKKAYIHTKVSNSEHNKKVIVVGGSEKKLALEDVQLPQENETDTNEFNFFLNYP